MQILHLLVTTSFPILCPKDSNISGHDVHILSAFGYVITRDHDSDERKMKSRNPQRKQNLKFEHVKADISNCVSGSIKTIQHS